MHVFLPNSLRLAIANHAEMTFPEECCGFMLGHDETEQNRRIIELYPMANYSETNRKKRFIIKPENLLAAERYSANCSIPIVGVYHSHPNHPSLPSSFDQKHAMPFFSYLIISCIEGQAATIQSFRLRDNRSHFDEEKLIFIP